MYDVIIIGGGPAAVAAAVYTARKKLKTLVIAEEFGGQSIVSDDIQNWIGEPHISGFDLAQKLEAHVRSFPDAVDVKTPEKAIKVQSVNCANGSRVCDFEVETDQGNRYHGKTVILAAGARRRKLGVPGEEKLNGKGVAYCSTCLPPDGAIVANSSVKSISEIEPNQFVLTHDGSFQKVDQTMERRYVGDLIKIKTRFFSEPVAVTSNHPVLATTVVKGKSQHYWRDFRINQPFWIRADTLTINHVLLYPIISDVQDRKSISLSKVLDLQIIGTEVKNKRESPTSVRIPNEIPVSKEFLRLIGYFIAEGSITQTGVNLYFSNKEQEYIRDVCSLFKNIFRINAHIKVEGSVTRIHIYSQIVRDFFQILCGRYAYNKKIPHWIVFLPADKLKEIVVGVYRGDGCKRKKDFCIVSSSRILTYQMRDILLKFGIIPAIQRRRVKDLNRGAGTIEGRRIRFRHDKYHIVIGGPFLRRMSDILGVVHEKIEIRKHTCSHAWIDDAYAYVPIRSIKKEPYEGSVYNLVVGKNNTYVTSSFIVHNCDAPLFSEKVVAVVGGGNAGVEAAVDLFPYASKIYLLERGDSLKADPVNQEEIKKNEKTEILFNSQVLEIRGDQFVTGLKYKDIKTGEEKTLELQGVFIEIGSVPNSEMVKGLVELDKYGQVVIDSKHASTSHPGIFAAGDITDDPYKQNNISAGDAVKAALAAYNYLLKREKQSPAAEPIASS